MKIPISYQLLPMDLRLSVRREFAKYVTDLPVGVSHYDLLSQNNCLCYPYYRYALYAAITQFSTEPLYACHRFVNLMALSDGGLPEARVSIRNA
jgi:hypothetical protein